MAPVSLSDRLAAHRLRRLPVTHRPSTSPMPARPGATKVLASNYRSPRRGPDGLLEGTSLGNTTDVNSQVAGQWKIVHTQWSFVRGERDTGEL